MKKCSKCDTVKPLNEFPRDKRNKDGLYTYCKMCSRAKSLAWKQANPERSREGQRQSRQKNPRVYRNKQLLWTFGITLEQYEQMEANQNGLCAICRKPETEIHPNSKKLRNFAVDHDHDTGHIRGLLCNSCNRALGLFNDNPDILRSAITYLENSKSP
jgi:hypothetical protein